MVGKRRINCIKFYWLSYKSSDFEMPKSIIINNFTFGSVLKRCSLHSSVFSWESLKPIESERRMRDYLLNFKSLQGPESREGKVDDVTDLKLNKRLVVQLTDMRTHSRKQVVNIRLSELFWTFWTNELVPKCFVSRYLSLVQVWYSDCSFWESSVS